MNQINSAAPAAIDIKDLATLVTGLSRFLFRLSNIASFREAGLGLAEWSALSTIADKSGINNRQLALLLGVSAQRVNQLTDSLKEMGFISLAATAADARKKSITITPAGSSRLAELNGKLQPLLDEALAKRPLVLKKTAATLTNVLMRVVTPPQPKR